MAVQYAFSRNHTSDFEAWSFFQASVIWYNLMILSRSSCLHDHDSKQPTYVNNHSVSTHPFLFLTFSTIFIYMSYSTLYYILNFVDGFSQLGSNVTVLSMFKVNEAKLWFWYIRCIQCIFNTQYIQLTARSIYNPMVSRGISVGSWGISVFQRETLIL